MKQCRGIAEERGTISVTGIGGCQENCTTVDWPTLMRVITAAVNELKI
jgi:hypothetical protein